MVLQSLGYISIRTAHFDDWSRFASDLLGMEKIEVSSNMIRFRMDENLQRLILQSSSDEGLGAIGWQVADRLALENMASRLDAADIAVNRGSALLAEERAVEELIWFHDPAGNRLELFYGPAAANSPFKCGRPIEGFRTGSFGMGHVVLNVSEIDAMLPFYRDLLGFQISDYGLSPYKLYFFHLNGRHHSLALVGSGTDSLHHFMVETLSLDDVGQGYDLAQLEEGRLAYTLGRHTNDHMTSFYAHSPSGFLVEYGWGGQIIDPLTWQPHETFDGPSFWGHERLNLPQDARARLRKMRLDAARRGARAPLISN